MSLLLSLKHGRYEVNGIQGQESKLESNTGDFKARI